MSEVRPTVLVTGGAGYVGSHACKALANAGFLPVTYDSLVRGHPSSVRWGPLETGSLTDVQRLREVIQAYRPAAVMHFAALADVSESMSDPLLYFQTNVAGTLSLLEAMVAENVGRLVFSSSCATYGQPLHMPVPEDAAQRPLSPYGRSKAMAEWIITDLVRAGRISAVMLRYFNAAGADLGGEIGEQHSTATRVIPLLLQAARRPDRSFVVNGDDHPTPDGTCIRDYVHVSDLAVAHVRAISATAHGAALQRFNLGSGEGASVKQLIGMVERITGRAVPHHVGPRRAGDPAMLVADISRARAELQWTPQRSSLETIVSSALRWEEKRESVSSASALAAET